MPCKKAMKRVKKIEYQERKRKQRLEDILRCVRRKICPECGENLVDESTKSDSTPTLSLRCTKCVYYYHNDF